MSVRVEILDEDGEWREAEGITFVEFHPAALIPAIQAAADTARTAERLLRQVTEGAEEAGHLYAAALRGPTVRPAWQTPYGPSRRRR
ncbi:hypothetical protein [Streptomyces sp. NPDC002952]|uniref:hypothetical protein n=1 Tax=Streptomyces sp. NPDC002952 TaxID=3364673 RepID=UPI003697BE81